MVGVLPADDDGQPQSSAVAGGAEQVDRHEPGPVTGQQPGTPRDDAEGIAPDRPQSPHAREPNRRSASDSELRTSDRRGARVVCGSVRR